MNAVDMNNYPAQDSAVSDNVQDAQCPVCHVRGGKRYLCDANGYQVVVCDYCDADFIHPMPTEAELQAYYDRSEYFEGGVEGGYENYDQQTVNVLELFGALLDRYPEQQGLTVLDIGCAYGTQLAMAAKRGWKCFGVEISEHARNTAMQRLDGQATIVKDVKDLPSGQKVDLIVMLDVLEHLPDPYKFFADLYAKGVVDENTTVAITTPNARSLDAVKSPSDWAYRHPPSHLIYFSEYSLRYFLERVWFANVEIQGVYPSEEDTGPELKLPRYAGLLALAKGMSRPAVTGTAWREDEELLVSQMYRLRSELRSSQDAIIHLKSRLQPVSEAFGRRASDRFYDSYPDAPAQLLELLSQRDRSITDLKHAMKEAEAELDSFRAKYFHSEASLHAIQHSKWFKLGDALTQQPWSLHKIVRLAYLITSLATPASVREKCAPMVARLQEAYARRRETAPPTGSQANAYVVRQPAPALAQRPRVVHVIANFMLGGSSRLVVDLIENLGSQYEQSVLTSFIPRPPAYTNLEIAELRFPDSIRPFLSHFSKVRPEFIHVHYWGDSDKPWYAKAIAAAEQLGIPIIENVNTPVAPFESKTVKRYVYVSDYVRNVFGKDHPTHVTVYPGSDFSHFERAADERLPEDCVGMVYRLERDKLNENAIAPFIRAVQKRPQTRVLIVGGGSLLEPFRNAVEAAGVSANFEFTGYVSYDELPNLYRRMSLFVAPVWKESFGQVSSFAMNMRVPVVGYDIGAIGEIVRDRTLLAEPENADMLADIIVRLLDSPPERDRIGAFQRQRVQGHFSVQAMVTAYASLYDDVVAKRIAA